jgi:hypothetical protein
MTIRNGLASFLRSVDSVLAFIDHQLFQLKKSSSHEIHPAVNTAATLPKADKLSIIPTILLGALCKLGGCIFPPINNVFNDHVIGCTLTKTWQDPNGERGKATCRQQLSNKHRVA